MNKKDLSVGGNKVISINSKLDSNGYFTDKWGNKIRPAKSEDKLDSPSEGEGTAKA